MNNIVKGILIFVGGAIVGGGASFIATKSILTEKNEKDISDRVQNALAEYRAHELSKLNNDIKEEIKDRIIKNEDVLDTSKAIKDYSEKLNRYKPTDIFVEEPKEEPEDDIPEDDTVEKHNAFVDSKRLDEKDILKEEVIAETNIVEAEVVTEEKPIVKVSSSRKRSYKTEAE